MSRPYRPSRPSRPSRTGELSPSSLARLAELLVAPSPEADAELRPEVVVVRAAAAAAFDLELHPFADDPVAALCRVRAPASALAVGLVAPATAHHLDGGRTERLAVVHLQHRDGVAVTGRCRPGGSPEVEVVTEPGAGCEGRVPDACRRVFGLPTPPPRTRVGLLAVALWLDRAVEMALWGEPLDGERLDELRPPLPPDWSAARVAVADGTLAVPGVDPAEARELAAWHDDGSFARWVLEVLPDPMGALDLLTGATSREVRAAMVGRLVDVLEAAPG